MMDGKREGLKLTNGGVYLVKYGGVVFGEKLIF